MPFAEKSARIVISRVGGLVLAVARTASFATSVAAVVPSAYLTGLMLASIPILRRRRASAELPEDAMTIAVLVPAHDEASGIAATVSSLRTLDFPDDWYDVIVIADNCSDSTADRAREAGATVWERHDKTLRGKGHALHWAIERLLLQEAPPNAFVFVDADCVASPNLLKEMAASFVRGAAAVQSDYVVANPDASTTAALRFAGFRLMNTVRPAGKEALGVSVGILGSGMGMTLGTLRAVPWTSASIVEDAEQHLRIVASGRRVEFVPACHVASAMPTTEEAAASQQMRWEGGRASIAREIAPRLLVDSLRRRDLRAVTAAADSFVPPQSLLAVTSIVGVASGFLLGAKRARRVALTAAGLQTVYVVGGIAVAGAPRSVWRALLHAPQLTVAKLRVFARLATSGSPDVFVRTARDTEAENRGSS